MIEFLQTSGNSLIFPVSSDRTFGPWLICSIGKTKREALLPRLQARGLKVEKLRALSKRARALVVVLFTFGRKGSLWQ